MEFKIYINLLQNLFVKLSENLRQDYLLHFIFGTFIAFPMVVYLPMYQVICFMFFIAAGKEIAWAYTFKTPPSIKDIIFTLLPLLPLLIVKYI